MVEGTSYQCPDCGQPRMGEECRGCEEIKGYRDLYERWPNHKLANGPLFLSALDFQRARAEKAETRAEAEFHRANTNEERLRIAMEEIERLRGAIEEHKDLRMGIGKTHRYDEELWAVLEGGAVEG